jgi:hypothetical protein
VDKCNALPCAPDLWVCTHTVPGPRTSSNTPSPLVNDPTTKASHKHCFKLNLKPFIPEAT